MTDIIPSKRTGDNVNGLGFFHNTIVYTDVIGIPVEGIKCTDYAVLFFSCKKIISQSMRCGKSALISFKIVEAFQINIPLFHRKSPDFRKLTAVSISGFSAKVTTSCTGSPSNSSRLLALNWM